MQVSRDPIALQTGCLVGAAAGDEGERRPNLTDDGQLLGAQLRRHKAQNAHTPGPAGQPDGGVG